MRHVTPVFTLSVMLYLAYSALVFFGHGNDSAAWMTTALLLCNLLTFRSVYPRWPRR